MTRMCPLCGAHVEQFAPLPAFFEHNLQENGCPWTFSDAETLNHEAYACTHCGGDDRSRLYALYIGDWFQSLPPGLAIQAVEFAPTGPLTRFVRRLLAESALGQLRTADLYQQDVDDRVDITNLTGYADARFDFLICSHVLEHVTDDRRAMRELFRILKPGARAIIMVPVVLALDHVDEDPSVTDPGERWRRFGQGDHVRAYSKRGFVERLEEAGFHVEQLGVEHFGRERFERHGISAQSVLYIAKRPAGQTAEAVG